MIPKVIELKLISIYLYICDIYNSSLKNLCQRFSNNDQPEFTDEEVITIYLYVMQVEQRLKIKQIHSFANDYCPADCQSDTSLVDSLPIVTRSGKRANSVAKELTDKGFCSTKNMYYSGLKLHALASRRPGHLPFPESIIITPASENDLNVQKQPGIFFFVAPSDFL